MSDYLKITVKELQALIATADSCEAMANDEDLGREAKLAVKAYRAVLKRSQLPTMGSVKPQSSSVTRAFNSS